MATFTLDPPTFDSLADDELIALRRLFRAQLGLMFDRGASAEAARPMAACINEVDARLARRGRLDLSTGELG